LSVSTREEANMTLRAWSGIAATLLCAGCQCGQPPLTDDPDDPVIEDSPVEDTEEEPVDTVPEPPCEQPEVEPNNSFDDANELAMEAQACGEFQTAVDADFWTFTLTEEAWLGIEVDAFGLGSEAVVSVAISSSETGVAAGINHHQGEPDVYVHFPSPPGTYDVLVRQTVGAFGGQGEGPDYFYELLATSSKPPMSWDLDETANETRETAMLLLSAAAPTPLRVFADVDGLGDQDWYRVNVPAGRHRMVIDVQAHEFGSMGNFMIERYRADGQLVQRLTAGEVGWEPDPWMEVRTIAAETHYLRIVEEEGGHGRPMWYVLELTLVEDE
jgi:hypothetical protein